jgi:hypothetical protein
MKEMLPCLISITPTSELMSKPLDWWQSSACCAGVYQFYQYYYVIEKLGVKACVNRAPFGEAARNTIGECMRITLLAMDKKNEAREMLQSTIITLDNVMQPCEADHYLVLGRQMWRELR